MRGSAAVFLVAFHGLLWLQGHAFQIGPVGGLARFSKVAPVPRPHVSYPVKPSAPSISPHITSRQPAQQVEGGALRSSVAINVDLPQPPGGSSKVKVIEPLFEGIKTDIKRKAPFFASDLVDGLNIKGLATTFFLFFACLAPAVAFGGLMGQATQGQIGTMEMIIATAYNGMAYALLSGQPLTIIGSTGPVLAFTLVLFKTAARLSLPFLPLYSWVGLWTSLILFLSSITSLSNLVGYFTRFTDEIFSLLISIIFLYEALRDLTGLITSPTVPFIKALLSAVTAVATFFTATSLVKLRRSRLFLRPIRETLADFGPTLGVVGGCFLGYLAKIHKGVGLDPLLIPASFSTTIGRPWLIDIFALPVWARWASAIPAMMASVLLFMDQNITVRLVCSNRHRLKKGAGYHLDMLVISILTAINSVLGFPWLVAATVRSLNHVKALSNFKKKPSGEEVIDSVQENRLTGFSIHALIGMSVLVFRPLLSQVPLAVLMGLFLYLGQSSLGGNQMYERLWLIITDPKLRPNHLWAQKVSYKVSTAFTLIQTVCLGGMWALKTSRIGVLFPLLIAALAPIRVLLEKAGWFSKEDLAILDADSEE